MTFQVALSGLNAASSDLAVTANNIANSSTNGFKYSRSEFADVFSVSPFGLSNTATGSGVRLTRVAQQFAQGNIDFTNNNLDLALSGEGLFTLSDNGSTVYSRAGAFGVDQNGFVVNSAGLRLQVYPADSNGVFDTGALSDLRLTTSDNPPAATTSVTIDSNLPADAAVPSIAPFDATDPASYNHTTSLTVFDSLGAPHTAAVFYVKTANPNEWELHTQIDGATLSGPDLLQYSDTGLLTSPAGGDVTLPPFTPTTGAADLNITLSLGDSTQFGDSFSVASLRQDGFTTGRLTGVEITQEGIVQVRFTNGQSSPLGQIALASFANVQGLQQLGDTSWGESFSSGPALRGQAGTGNFGLIQSGALESSNVDLTEQLVNMITAQRNFQANAQVISTADQVTQTVINIR